VARKPLNDSFPLPTLTVFPERGKRGNRRENLWTPGRKKKKKKKKKRRYEAKR